MYINCHSYYSLRFGTFSEVDLLKLAQQNNVITLALTDINNTSACLNFIRKAKDFNIKPVVGIDFRVGAQQNFIGIAKNNAGFKELNSFLSHYSERKLKLPETAPAFKDSYIVYPFEKVLQLNKTTFLDCEFIGVSVEELRKLRFSKLNTYTDKLVVLQPVTVRSQKDFNAHRLLRAIDNNALLSKLCPTEECKITDKMLSAEALELAFKEFPHIIKNTNRLLEDCNIHFNFGLDRVSQNLKLFTTSFDEDCLLLENLCQEGLKKRYQNPNKKVFMRLKNRIRYY